MAKQLTRAQLVEQLAASHVAYAALEVRLSEAIARSTPIASVSTRIGSGSQRAPNVLHAHRVVRAAPVISEYRKQLAALRQKAIDTGKTVIVMAQHGSRA